MLLTVMQYYLTSSCSGENTDLYFLPPKILVMILNQITHLSSLCVISFLLIFFVSPWVLTHVSLWVSFRVFIICKWPLSFHSQKSTKLQVFITPKCYKSRGKGINIHWGLTITYFVACYIIFLFNVHNSETCIFYPTLKNEEIEFRENKKFSQGKVVEPRFELWVVTCKGRLYTVLYFNTRNDFILLFGWSEAFSLTCVNNSKRKDLILFSLVKRDTALMESEMKAVTLRIPFSARWEVLLFNRFTASVGRNSMSSSSI